MENNSICKNSKEIVPSSKLTDAGINCQQQETGNSFQKLKLFLDDSLAKILISTMLLRNMNIERTLLKERNRVLKQKATFTVTVTQLIAELNKEVHKKVFERESGSEEKIEGIKKEMEKYKLKIRSSEEYATKLSRTLRIFRQSLKQTPENLEGSIKVKLSTNEGVSSSSKIAMGRVLLSASPNESSSMDWKVERRQRSKEWRKNSPQCSIEGSNLWKLSTPILVKAREKLQALTTQLHVEFQRQMISIKMPSRSKLLKIKALEKEIENCVHTIKEEEEHVISFYDSVIDSKNVELKMNAKSEIIIHAYFEK